MFHINILTNESCRRCTKLIYNRICLPCDIFCIIFHLRPNCSYKASRQEKERWDLKFETSYNFNKRQVLQNFSVQHCYSIQFALIKASNMADHSLVSTGFSSKSCCRGLELLGSGVKALSSCPPGLFITFWHLVRHKTSACLNSVFVMSTQPS